VIGNWYKQESDVPAPTRLVVLVLLLGSTNLGFVVSIFLARSGGDGLAGNGFLNYALLATMIWISLVVYLFTPAFRIRCSRFAMTLPLDSRRVWLRNLVSTLSIGSLILLLMCGSLALALKVLVPETGDITISEPGVPSLTAALVSCMFLVIVMLQSVKPGLNKLTMTKYDILAILAISLSGLLVVLVLGTLPLLVTVVPLLFAVILGYRTCRELPNTFSLYPREASKMDQPGASPRAVYRPVSGQGMSRVGQSILLWNTIQRSMAKFAGLRWVPYPILFGFGMVMSGVYSAAIGHDAIRFVYIFLVAYCMVAFVAGQLSYLKTIDPLPIPRNVIFAVLMLPTLFSTLAGYGAGWVWAQSAQQESGLIRMLGVNEPRPETIRPDSYVFTVQREYLEIAWDGEPADVMAPWGESHPVWQVRPLKGTTPVLFSPFSSPRGSSIDFVAWQLSRAVQAIYGRSIPPQEIRERYLLVVDDGLIVARGEGLTLQRDYGLQALARGPMLPIIMLPTCLVWLLAVYLFLLANRAGVKDSRRKKAYFAIMGGLLLLHITHLPLLMLDILEPSGLDGVISILMTQLDEAVPAAGFLVWAVAVVIFIGCYRIVRASFERIEVSPGGPDLWFPLLDGKSKG
jgi:hypothetical protein